MSKIEQFWRDATADDVAEIMKTGNPIPARLRDKDNEVWREDLVSGWRLPRFLPGAIWIDADGVHWKQCQVYREPSWYTNKPDPGPGWRLLDKFPDEPKLATDETRNRDGQMWVPITKENGKQYPTVWYRRRIEVDPETKHYVLRVGDTVETRSGDRIKCVEPGVEQRHYKLRVTDTISTPNGQTITITAKGFEVKQ